MIFNETFIENAMQSNQYLYVRQAGILHHDAHYTISRENSETGVIGFIQSGVLWIESAGNRMQVCNQESFILPNQTCYTIYADHQNPPCIYWLNLRGDLFSALCTSLLHGQILISRYHALNDILHLFTLIKDAGNVQAVIKAVFSLLTDIKFQEIEKPATQEKSEPSLVTQLDSYVCNHIQYDFSVQEMAKAFYMSTDSLNRIFQKEFQTTPYQLNTNLFFS